MKITRSAWITATARAMNNEPAKKLFENSPEMFSLFTSYSHVLLMHFNDTEQTYDSFGSAVTDIATDLVKDLVVSAASTLVIMTLITFAITIYHELETLSNDEKTPDDFDQYKAELKSKLG